jgi:flagellar P-ring protein precursor FlgI
MVTADLPAFSKPGQRIDVTVSAIGKAKSLRGGSLVLAPLYGADGKIYAMAQGNLAVGGLASRPRTGRNFGQCAHRWPHRRRGQRGTRGRYRL